MGEIGQHYEVTSNRPYRRKGTYRLQVLLLSFCSIDSAFQVVSACPAGKCREPCPNTMSVCLDAFLLSVYSTPNAARDERCGIAQGARQILG